jgi:glyoxylate reductase
LVLSEGRLPGSAFAELTNIEIADRPLGEYVAAPRTDVEAIISLGTPVHDGLLSFLPSLKLVARFGVGYDTVDVEACSRHGVMVTITVGAVESATAELTLALMLGVRRRLVAAHNAVRDGGWSETVTGLPDAEGLDSATVGLVGFGRIGQKVAACVHLLGASVLYTARRRLSAGDEAATGARWVGLDSLLTASDIVSIHCPLDASTRGLIAARELGLMRDGATLINTARGPIIDETALVNEIASGRLRAGLDVFEDEPLVPEALRASPNVLLSPHAGTATRLARSEMARLCVANVQAALAGDPPCISSLSRNRYSRSSP